MSAQCVLRTVELSCNRRHAVAKKGKLDSLGIGFREWGGETVLILDLDISGTHTSGRSTIHDNSAVCIQHLKTHLFVLS